MGEAAELNTADPRRMSDAVSAVLRFGVLLSAAVIALGTLLLLLRFGSLDSGSLLTYYPSAPHGGFDPSLTALAAGLSSLNPYSVIDAGTLILLATPVARVALSALLFAAERDRPYVYITLTVLSLLLFSMLVTPFIPHFNG
ncbi:MAG: DUF1634 domain-containing protein [Thaumarchaeota archaeon]|nr:DUF1634 domain-containing protein [Nitrososphaerota archaeon]